MLTLPSPFSGRAQFLAVAAWIVASAITSQADFLTGNVLELTVSSALGSAALSVRESQGAWNADRSQFRWTRSTSLPMVDPSNGALIGTLLNADVTVRASTVSEISLSFAIVSGSELTTVVAQTARTTFRRITQPFAVGRATASFTASDLNANGALLTALGTPGAGALRAHFNGVYPGGPLFSQLVSIVFAGATGTATGTQNDPPFGYRTVGSLVDNINLRVGYTITPGDRSSCTTRFTLPDPPLPCPGDVDLDRDVDVADLALLLGSYGESAGSPTYNINADFNDDGIVGLADLNTVLNNYLLPCAVGGLLEWNPGDVVYETN